jgi:hypothetical protein
MFKSENGYVYIIGDDGDVLCWRKDDSSPNDPARHRRRLRRGFTPLKLVRRHPPQLDAFIKQGVDGPVTKQGPAGPFIKGP